MGGQQAASTMEQVMVKAAKRRGKTLEAKTLNKQIEEIKERFDSQSNAFLTSGRLLDHGMIDPRDTRRYVCEWVETAYKIVSSPAELVSRPLQFRP